MFTVTYSYPVYDCGRVAGEPIRMAKIEAETAEQATEKFWGLLKSKGPMLARMTKIISVE